MSNPTNEQELDNDRIEQIQTLRLDPNTPSLTRIELTNELAHLVVRVASGKYKSAR